MLNKFKKFKGFRGPPKSGFLGTIFYENERLVMRSYYSESRVAFIKALEGSRYNPQEKTWSVPYKHLQVLRSSALFSAKAILWKLPDWFDPLDEAQRKQHFLRASEHFNLDRFEIAQQSIELLDLGAIISSDAETPGLILNSGFTPRLANLLKAMPGVYASTGAQVFKFSSALIVPLIKKLSTQKISFAVSSETGKRLKESAKQRELALAGQALPYEVLHQAALTPILELDQQGIFKLVDHNPAQLALLFPTQANQSLRLKAANELSTLEARTLIERSKQSNLQVFLTEAAGSSLQSQTDQTSNGLWLLGEFEVLKLTLSLGVTSDLLDRLGELPGVSLKTLKESNRIEISLSPSSVLSVKQKIEDLLSEYEISCESSTEVKLFCKDLLDRQRLNQRRQHYMDLKDISVASLNFSEPALPQKMFAHQRIAVSWLRETPFAFLGDDMGLGKTLCILAYFDSLKEDQLIQQMLVLAPNSLLQNWAREAQQWFPNRRVLILEGDKKNRRSLLAREQCADIDAADILVLNYEAARLDYILEPLHELCARRPTLLCLDESQRVKSPQSKSFKAVKSLARLCQRRVLLSGTPIPNKITDIWSQFYILDGGTRFGTSYYRWLTEIAEVGNKYSEYAIKSIKPGAIECIASRVQELMLRRKKNELLDLPPKLFSQRDIELTGDQLTRYDEIREQLLIRLSALDGDDFVRQINSVLEQYLRAVQIASNPRLVDPNWKGEPAKFLELDEIINEVVEGQAQKLIIWTNYLQNCSELCQRYAKHGVAEFNGNVSTTERTEIIRKFQHEASPKILVAIPAAGGVGITLTAAQVAVYLDRTWNAEHWLQSIDRIHRIGQKGSVHIISLIAGKIDALIGYSLRHKEKTQQKLLGDYALQASYPSRQEFLQALEGRH